MSAWVTAVAPSPSCMPDPEQALNEYMLDEGVSDLVKGSTWGSHEQRAQRSEPSSLPPPNLWISNVILTGLVFS